jgi:hypothetical protein
MAARDARDFEATQCRSAESLLVIYYFGHGRREPDGLAFVHRGPKKESRESMTFQRMFYTVRAGVSLPKTPSALIPLNLRALPCNLPKR